MHGKSPYRHKRPGNACSAADALRRSRPVVSRLTISVSPSQSLERKCISRANGLRNSRWATAVSLIFRGAQEIRSRGRQIGRFTFRRAMSVEMESHCVCFPVDGTNMDRLRSFRKARAITALRRREEITNGRGSSSTDTAKSRRPPLVGLSSMFRYADRARATDIREN